MQRVASPGQAGQSHLPRRGYLRPVPRRARPPPHPLHFPPLLQAGGGLPPFTTPRSSQTVTGEMPTGGRWLGDGTGGGGLFEVPYNLSSILPRSGENAFTAGASRPSTTQEGASRGGYGSRPSTTQESASRGVSGPSSPMMAYSKRPGTSGPAIGTGGGGGGRAGGGPPSRGGNSAFMPATPGGGGGDGSGGNAGGGKWPRPSSDATGRRKDYSYSSLPPAVADGSPYLAAAMSAASAASALAPDEAAVLRAAAEMRASTAPIDVGGRRAVLGAVMAAPSMPRPQRPGTSPAAAGTPPPPAWPVQQSATSGVGSQTAAGSPRKGEATAASGAPKVSQLPPGFLSMIQGQSKVPTAASGGRNNAPVRMSTLGGGFRSYRGGRTM